MKKLAILACVMTVSAGFAMAQQTVSIPFFADGGSFAAFVGLQNTSAGTIGVTVSYLDATGSNAESGGTFSLAPGESVSFRPSTAGGGEVQKHATDASYDFGSISMGTDGGTVAGRYVQVDGNGAFAHNVAVQ